MNQDQILVVKSDQTLYRQIRKRMLLMGMDVHYVELPEMVLSLLI